ncbi:MAG: acetyl-CoA carboxylase biotin carboxyl carrier protein subunit [Flavobacteriales bacterium]|nr:acetyl-CoA carboxylase biotin carboxyl carrier protein subunit [Flavobacteriales bacterium]
MEWEVRWPDGQTEQVQGDAASSWDWKPVGDGVFDVRMGHRNVRVELVNGPDNAGHVMVRVNGVERQLQVLDRQMLLLESMGMSSVETGLEMEVLAPMPGKVLSVGVAKGETVEEGDALLVLEAMKMENVIRAPRAGVLASVEVGSGIAVEKGTALVTYESES